MMRVRSKILLTALISFLVIECGYAQWEQPYKTALGIRGGGTPGLNFKHFTADEEALEGLIGLWSSGISLTALYEFHRPAFNVNGLYWYYGIGGHLGVGANQKHYRRSGPFDRESDEVGIGIDVIGAIAYKFPNLPIAIALDLKPFIEFDTEGEILADPDPGINLRFTF